jgi:hypothetical protein
MGERSEAEREPRDCSRTIVSHHPATFAHPAREVANLAYFDARAPARVPGLASHF